MARPPNRLDTPSFGNLVPMTRRRHLQMLSLLPLGAVPLFASQAALAEPACTLAPAITEGPFWVDEKLNRADVTTGTSRASVINAVPMSLAIYVRNAAGQLCGNQLAAGVQVDIWHCDANGEYSDAPALGQSSTLGQDFLRGYQVSDANGRVSFTTIYPGWYPGRATHIHLRARVYDSAGNVTYNYVSQLFFDDAFTDQVYARGPYNARGARGTRNSNDGIFRDAPVPPLATLSNRSDGGVHAEISLGLTGVPANANFRAFSASAVNQGTAAMPHVEANVVVSTADVGRTANIYIAADVSGQWYFNNGSYWMRVANPTQNGFPAFTRGVLQDSHTLTILSGINTSSLGRIRIYAGYGTDNLDMLLNSRYQLVHTLNP
jgi:protocatechuate 3,4-dioxygenase beta subunit